MATRINCVERRDNGIGDSTVVGYGDPIAGWVQNKADAVMRARLGIETFFVDHFGPAVYALVEGPPGGQYLKTTADYTRANNIGSLPLCPRGLRRV